MESAQSYPDWKAPAEDGAILVWPEPRDILSQTRENQKQLSSSDSFQISGIPLNELRRRQRADIGHADDAKPLVASGHQTELIHPGVWVKHILINAATREIGGAAVHFAVDTDGPKHLTLRWPGGGVPVTDDPNLSSAAWCRWLEAPSPRHLAKLAEQATQAAEKWNFKPMLPAIFTSLRSELGQRCNLSGAIKDAIHDLDHSLGLRHDSQLVSPILMGEPYLAFVHHLMSDAATFAGVYNAALAKFRRLHKTRSPMRPMPDLFVSPDAAETPFWLDDLATGKRSRPSVFARDDGFVLKLLGGEEFVFRARQDGFTAASGLAGWLKSTNHRLSPRALTLTTFIRLLIADNFIHGIGGGRYDQVSDDLIANYFHLSPPKFAVTTGTLFFPEAVNRQRVCVPCVLRDGHRIRHSVLGKRKMALVSQIDTLPRRSRQRQAAFAAMQRERNEKLTVDLRFSRWEQRLRDTQKQALEDQTIFDRELFYAIQPRQRLLELIERYDAAFRQ